MISPGGKPASRIPRAYASTPSWVGRYGISIQVLYCGAVNICSAGMAPDAGKYRPDAAR